MKIVLAYSGGLDTSVAIKWLHEKYDADIVTMIVDVGQRENLEEIAQRAKEIGATNHYCIDSIEEFAQSYLKPEIMANGLYEGKYPLLSSLSRPLIASKVVEVANKEHADAVAHGCTGKGNDQVRMEVTIKAMAPHLEVLAPIRDWDLSREAEIEYATKMGIPVVPKKSKYSIDQNLWGRSIECGGMEEPDFEPPEDAFEWTVAPEKAPDHPEYLRLDFEQGVPVSVNEDKMPLRSITSELNGIAGRHGVGRIDHVEDRVIGLKSREVYECPGAIAILEAHKDLEKMVLTKHELDFKNLVDLKWAELVYCGLWVDPLRSDLEAFIKTTQERIDGWVKLKLYKGNLLTVGRSSPNSLCDWRMDFDQKLSRGFVERWGSQSVLSSKFGYHTPPVYSRQPER